MNFRRRREALTDYRKRLALVKSGIDRIVVRKTNRRIIGEIVRYEEKGDVVLAYADSLLLASKFSWPSRSNRPTAYLTGLLLAKAAKAKIKSDAEYILDIGLSSPVRNSLPFVFAKGCIDGGLRLRSGIEVKEGIYNYSEIGYAKAASEKEGTIRQYGRFLRDGIRIESLNSLFEETRKKILAE